MWRMRQGRVPKVALRTPTSIFLLSVLVAGVLSPSGLCALMCQRHLQPETQRACGHSSQQMSGMTHHHTAGMIYPDGHVLTHPSCPSNCDAVARLILSKKATARVKARQTSTVEPESTDNFTSADIATAWCSHGDPPDRKKCMPAFSILRI